MRARVLLLACLAALAQVCAGAGADSATEHARQLQTTKAPNLTEAQRQSACSFEMGWCAGGAPRSLPVALAFFKTLSDGFHGTKKILTAG